MVSVRGVAASAAVFSGGSPIAYYIDSLPFGLIDTAIAPDQNVYDLQRIEVLRGPQGTLYGASALNGVVRILTNDVDLNKFDAKVRVTDSSTSGGGNNYRGDMAVNVPIVEGKLGVRAVAGYGYDSGWIDSPRVDNINDSRVHNYRVKVSAQPTDGLSIGLSAWKSRDAYGAPPTGNERDFNDETLDQSIHSGFDAYNMKLGYDGSVFSISSMTSYLDYSNSSGLDLNSFIHVSSLLHTGFDAHIFSQEVVANSTHSESWRWSVGGIYRRGTEDLVQSFSDVLSFIPSTNILNVSRSAAAFGEVTRLFGQNRFEATLGLRYFTDHVNSEDNLDTGNPTNPVVKKTLRFHATSPRAVLAWHPAENSTVYGSYSEGFRSGFPQGANVPADFPDLVGDTLKNYEVGTKGVLAGGRVNYNVAVYYMDWQDVQQTLSVLWHGVPTTAFVNGQSASGVGAEFAVNAEVLTGLVLGLSFGWNDLRMDADTTSTTGILFHKGDRLSFSPEYTGGASLQYGFPLGTGGLRANLSASESYTSQMLDHAIGVVATGDEMLSTRLSAEVASPDRWSVMLFVDNATNARKTPVRIAGGSVDFDLRNRPRTAGLQLDYHF
jgi:outer membrane receptor protein involved in Fe transport